MSHDNPWPRRKKALQLLAAGGSLSLDELLLLSTAYLRTPSRSVYRSLKCIGRVLAKEVNRDLPCIVPNYKTVKNLKVSLSQAGWMSGCRPITYIEYLGASKKLSRDLAVPLGLHIEFGSRLHAGHDEYEYLILVGERNIDIKWDNFNTDLDYWKKYFRGCGGYVNESRLANIKNVIAAKRKQ